MRIKSIRATQPKAVRDPDDWRVWLGQIAVTVETEDGLAGYGVGGGGNAGIHVIETALSRLLIGADATCIEDLWEEMYRATRPYGRKGIAVMAISGLDLALWDLKGKREGKTVAEVLAKQAGQACKPIRCYKTGFSAEEVIRTGTRGFRALKLHLGIDPNREAGDIVGPIRRVREALGPGVQAMASIDSDPLAESGRPWIDWVRGQPEIVEGEIVIPETPGFGVSLPS